MWKGFNRHMRYTNNARQMKTHRFLFLVFFLIFSPLSLRSQEVVHTGDLIIEDFSALFGIPNFTTLTRVTGSVIIRGSALTSAPPLTTIQTIEGNLEVKGLTALPNISDFLPALTNVGGDVIIQNNTVLTRIDGLMALRDIGGSLQIGGVGDDEGNPALEVLVGAVVSGMPSVPAFQALRTLGGSLIIANNGMLDDYPLFDDLPSIGGSLRIQNNAAMSTFPSFNLLTTITTDFHIESMPLPTALPDFASLTSVGGNIVLRNNTALSACCSFLDILNNPSGTVNITGNALGCSSRDEVSNSCYTGGNLNIDNASKVPGNVRLLTRISGNLIISGGSHRSFPDFAALTEVTGNITVQGIHTVSGSTVKPPDGTGGTFAADNIFPELDSVGGDIVFEQNFNIGSLRNVFAKLRHIGGVLRFGREPTSNISYANRRFDALTGFDLLESVKGFALYEDADANDTRLTNIENFPTFPALRRIGSEGIYVRYFALGEMEDAANGVILFPLLERVEGSVQFLDSEEARNLPSFPKLRFIGGNIFLSNLEALTSVTGFNKLRVVGSIQMINSMRSLRTVEGFNVLETAENLSISAFSALRLISGFNNLKSLTEIGSSSGFRMRVTDGGSVTEAIEITGFARLEEVAGQFLITGAFNRVPDFSNLRTVTFLTISNTRLTALPSFNKLRSANRVQILTNSSLTNCCAIKHISVTDLQRPNVQFNNGNGQGCRSENDINTNCRRDIDVPTTIRLNAVAGSSNLYVNVRNNTPWRLVPEAGATWLRNFSVVANNNARNITFDFTQNTGAERMATLTVSNTDTGTPISHTITVIQSAASTRELFTPILFYRLPSISSTRLR